MRREECGKRMKKIYKNCVERSRKESSRNDDEDGKEGEETLQNVQHYGIVIDIGRAFLLCLCLL